MPKLLTLREAVAKAVREAQNDAEFWDANTTVPMTNRERQLVKKVAETFGRRVIMYVEGV